MVSEKLSPDIFEKAPYNQIPKHLHDGILRYVNERRPVGGFLEAVISNDLLGVFSRADTRSYAALKEIVGLFYHEVDSRCWGNPEAYKNWLERAAA